ncbi:amidohydrolase family protein [Candidatus Bathyarchaeota archaeon]|nr:amidohydrolase family protein [Candidatus Bathyarchaeota archaeon]
MLACSAEIFTGNLIVGNGQIIKDVWLGIENGTIREIVKGDLKKQYGEIFHFPDSYILPGLIDAHVHIRYGTNPDSIPKTDEYQALRGAENARKALMSGVTTLGDAGALRNIGFSVRDAINDGVIVGPRVFTSGEMITMTGGRSKQPGERLEVTGEDQARRATRALLMYHGADFIKLGATGAISSPHTGPRHPQLTVDEMKACVDEAHKCGKMVHSHCYGEQGISNSLDAGVDVIVHGQGLTDEHIERMYDDDIILLPTLKTFCGHMEHLGEGGVHERIITTGIWDETEPNFRYALRNGVLIAMGTDAGMPDNVFGDNPRDLGYMVEWGMSPEEAIKAGTLNAAKTLGVDNKLGTLEEGKMADLIILNNNPLENISEIWQSLDRVMLNGCFLR